MLLGVHPEAFATILAAHTVGARVVGVRPGLTDAQVEHLLSLDITLVVRDEDVPGLLDAPAEPLHCNGKPDDIARLIHTSGSTGVPKACAQTYASMTNYWNARPAAWPPVIRELAPRLGRYLVFGSLSSQVMFEYAVLTLTAGGTVVVAGDPADAITRQRATARVITVPGLAKLVAAQRHSPADLSTLRALVVSGSPLTARTPPRGPGGAGTGRLPRLRADRDRHDLDGHAVRPSRHRGDTRGGGGDPRR
ncbi:AMP-binding protein [Lentzea sp. E54]|uniref:AMP-binding protein n=1 Tax=Lentzea xerophila TaxID=3435883 RepID=UPI003DA39AC8